jgi:hypothetical protein
LFFPETPVKIERGLLDNEAVEGKDAVFECIVSKSKWKKNGADIPVRWLKGDREIKYGNKYSIEVDGCTHRLIIKDLSFDDQNIYGFAIGADKSTANLKIKGMFRNLVYSSSLF